MQVTIQARVMGVKKFSGVIEGKTIDFCRVIAATPFDESQGDKLGMAATEYDFGGSENFERFKNLTLPFDAALNCEVVVSGKGQKFKVIDFKSINNGVNPSKA